MFEGEPKVNDLTKRPETAGHSIEALDNFITAMLDSLSASGLDVSRLYQEYETLPDEQAALDQFYRKLQIFKEQREDALITMEYYGDLTEEEKQRIRQFDREVMAAYKDEENFLGNGATAEVYAMASNDVMCGKFITNQERYNENNHIRVEYGFLSKAYEATKDETVRTPYPIFLRIHPNEGHSYGMEKIHGANLSDILEQPEKFRELIDIATQLDRSQLEEDILAFLSRMHDTGIAHGDLFKRNIMLDVNGKLYVIDFGKAKEILHAENEEDQKKYDRNAARQSIRSFFKELEGLTN